MSEQASDGRAVPVVVVGAGPSGLAVATLLGQYGVECLVLDRWEGVYQLPRAVHLDDEIYRILNRLGVAARFAAMSRPARGLRLLTAEHRVIAEFQRSADSATHGYPQANMFDQPGLEQLMRENLRSVPSVSLRGDVEVNRVTQGNTTARVDFTDRVTGARESVLAGYVLGCDGANSVVREAMGAVMEDLGFEQRWLILDVDTTVPLNQWDGVHQLCDPHRAGTYMRVGKVRYRWEFRLLPGETAADFSSLEALHPLIRPWTRDAPAEDLHVIRVVEYTFRAQVANKWRDRRIFLLGDAAHLTPPFIGQGMGAGLRDAMNLAWKLAGVLAGDLPGITLDSYQAERRRHAKRTINLAKFVGRAMTAGGRVGSVLRRLLIPGLHLAAAPEPSGTARPAGFRTRFLALTGTSAVGRFCPNAPTSVTSNAARFDEIAGNGFTLLAPAITSAERERILQKGAAPVAPEAGSELHQWLVRHRIAAAVVRPDRTIMLTAASVSESISRLPSFHLVTANAERTE
ncbi:bifunctional 3-(3-hydroxy-phenyl)propionate/3-hydroxycinnamic acid hydroxylase [Arthrobacter sp. ISL-48]|uniref:bifunctional 3-(3-hydroxy-phenyl)propionate/3-hydroxycinnamic acid hydroxylase MhpA n=1 Tax=Arthrobacter sp. ISL-48 TaxID=2819110 RepID=UPI001BEA1DA2|nr:bifunctional 3-(3-hydroxy-phenyl)propionate/3-hydroxycinnamic acid hydroxylase [Arthrobacter sp. ISL-48]MBT2534512.1 bifunctional 3-(3-hydroxy-phenyl)propionate/3-hydroxycinnamic acid hydroxylase [Arthrobacter sp. ISL-48]